GTSASHAFVWTQARGLIDIGTFGDGCCSSARAVNALGMVVGESNIASTGDLRTASHAFLWTASTGMVDLGTLGGSQSAAYAINDDGIVVGRSSTPGDVETHAFVWTQSGGMVDLGSLGGTFSQAIAVDK